MHHVYVLKSLSDHGWYIGYTEDVNQRIKDHNAGNNISTKPRRPLVVIYYETYLNKLDALGREKFLKSGSGRMFLKKQMKYYLSEEDQSNSHISSVALNNSRFIDNIGALECEYQAHRREYGEVPKRLKGGDC